MLRRGLHGACRRRLLDGTMRRTNEEQGQVHYPRREERDQRPPPALLALFGQFFCGRAWGSYPVKHKTPDRARDTYEAV